MSWAMAAAGVNIAGGLFGAVGNLKSGKAAQAVGEYNAQIQERNARVQEQAADRKLFMQDVENVRFRQEAKSFLQGVGVAYRKSGVVASGGTPLLVLLDSAEKADEDMENATYNSRVAALGMRETATGLRMDASLKRIEGRIRRQQYQSKAFASLLGSASDAYRSYKLG